MHFLDSYPIDVSHLNFNILYSVSAITLDIYLSGEGGTVEEISAILKEEIGCSISFYFG